MSPRAVALDDSAAGPVGAANPRALIDEAELDAEQNERRSTHPFAVYCQRVLKECDIPDSQGAREIASSVCGIVARLPTIVEGKANIERQAALIVEDVSAERRQAGDRMLWEPVIAKVAERALALRVAGEAVVDGPGAS